ncbi:MAG: phosphatidylglycerophosphatase A [Phycisphaerae bacterium]|nr:phosphatidylglycerophosphatase A [Phycisphaerae bacterium]
MNSVRAFFITVGGSGYAPFASGSWGSLAAVALFAALWLALKQWMPTSFNPALLGCTIAGVTIAGVMSVAWGDWAIRTWGRKDPKPFVLDEFAGQWIALLFPVVHAGADLASWSAFLALQLFLFRLFDVWKPPPARQLEQLPAGWGILLDDLFAGAYANIVGQLLWRYAGLAKWLGLSQAAFVFGA